MKLSNLSKALQPYNLADFTDIEITKDVFSVKIINAEVGSQQWAVRSAEYARQFELTDIAPRIGELLSHQVTEESLHLLAHVIVTDWALKDDDGKKVKYDPVQAIELFETMPRIAAKLMQACHTSSMFTREWTQLALKN